mmetsp:Transcript_52206/g.62859  ORF Transcript_52206/g.62859 Transcript_52206/m.62859 type:complete len:225 (-) Transcript_52206:259-933(-)|eukprot:CAMPEP_0172500034 /NCGR_PEP_ID=MMETSP1066-20121228/133723_1 /TAXON_ID=671091 /ORGANISM="Coscinodiscus wailesii, Strain CCMP2513" /LENGTH=224 /DNA_ID=CAMNT_0013274089 /DNA_START=65 /DNA_END=739 /DNA_ORIENTATION=+
MARRIGIISTITIFITSATISETFTPHSPPAKSLSGQYLPFTKVDYNAKTREKDDTTRSTTPRRAFLGFLITGSTASTTFSSPVYAAYGDSAKVKAPGLGNYIDYLIDSAATVDESAFLYKGADREVQLQRIADAAARLEDVKSLAEEKKWSQVQGILTGPLGTLVVTMNQVAVGNGKAQAAAKKVKADIYAIADGARMKSEAGCVKNALAASASLEAFVKVAF